MQFREMKAAKAVGCYVIMKGARFVAKVQTHRSAAGVMQVDVWQDYKAATRSTKAAGRATLMVYQSARAGGGGYDKFTACLAGMWVDGHKLADHCGESLKPPKGSTVFPFGFKTPKGYTLANPGLEIEGYRNCYKQAGLRYLEALGYNVIEGI